MLRAFKISRFYINKQKYYLLFGFKKLGQNEKATCNLMVDKLNFPSFNTKGRKEDQQTSSPGLTRRRATGSREQCLQNVIYLKYKIFNYRYLPSLSKL